MNTAWTDKVDLNMPLPEYPRPQLARRLWLNLNGPWEYAITTSARHPKEFEGQIIVPFSPESELSGVNRSLKAGEYLWYRRDIALPQEFAGKRVILNFGAVDQCATVWVNSTQVVSHIGGYLPFSADVTDAVEDGRLLITVRVTDDTDRSFHSRGKQKTRRGGIWYTPQSGIWQTVWLEAVPESYVRNLRITPDFDGAAVDISAEIVGDEDAYAHFGGESYLLPARIPVPDFEPWSPEHPKLYGFSVTCGEDEVQSYFAMRKFSVEKDKDGVERLFLNNEPYFHNGLLDQGYWPDGLYTAPSDEALIFDIETVKKLGYNMLRKHIKIEPQRWYYHCDRLGMLVWQDMINGGEEYRLLYTTYIPTVIKRLRKIKDNKYALLSRRNPKGRREWKKECLETIEQLYNCTCICTWVLFNEGWGQFDAAENTEMVRKVDNSRLIDAHSGWFDQNAGDLKSVHIYFFDLVTEQNRKPYAISEYGGLACGIEGHSYSDDVFGYGTYSVHDLKKEYKKMQRKIQDLYPEGLSAAVYTQLTDIEEEVNGLLTYDRKVSKLDMRL